MKRVKRPSMSCPTCGPPGSTWPRKQARMALSAKTGSSKRSGSTGCSFSSRQKVRSDSSEAPRRLSGDALTQRPIPGISHWICMLRRKPRSFYRVPMVSGASHLKDTRFLAGIDETRTNVMRPQPILFDDIDSQRMPDMTSSTHPAVRSMRNVFSEFYLVLALVFALGMVAQPAHAAATQTFTTLTVSNSSGVTTTAIDRRAHV